MPTPREVHDALYTAMEAMDLDGMYALMDENIVYQNMPQSPINGRSTLKAKWARFAIERLSAEIITVAVSGNVVLNERRDHLVVDGKEIKMPMAASITVENGLITAWREYYDLRNFERQLGKTHPDGN